MNTWWCRRGITLTRTFRGILGGFVLLVLAGCSAEYYIRAAYEEGRILWRRKPIRTLLAEEGLAPDIRSKLEMVLKLRNFAAADLRLDVAGNYAAYSYVDRPVLLHVLTAVPKTSLEPHTWWFPVVGRVPYKGYFDLSGAREEADSLAAQGYDTHIRSAGAFSTLGWFNDPLLERLLKLDRVSLADVVLHELFHSTLFVRDSVRFNESVANFVGKRGAIDFFVRHYGAQSDEAKMARRAWQEELEFSALMMELTRCLRVLYERPGLETDKLRGREQVFARTRRQWGEVLAGRPDHRYASFGRGSLDNAVILQSLLYVTDLGRFEEVYRREREDLLRAIGTVRIVSRGAGDLFEGLPRLAVGRPNGKDLDFELCGVPL